VLNLIVQDNKGLTTRQAQIYAIQEVCMDLGIPIENWKSIETDNNVLSSLNQKMMERLNGRPSPLKSTRPSANREIKLDRLNIRTYPYKADTDVKKWKWLKDLIDNGAITINIYVDLLSELNLENKISKKKQYAFKQGFDVFII